jgi:hypothetical protein
MSPEDLNDRLRGKPFLPFKIVLTDGQTYDVSRPDFVLVARRTAVIGVKKSDAQPYFDRYHIVSLLHIVRLEPAEAAPKDGNGE